MPSATKVEFTNLFPTRYEAQDRNGVWFVFRPDPDGTFHYCRRDMPKRSIENFSAHRTTEIAVFSIPKVCHAEIKVVAGRMFVECHTKTPRERVETIPVPNGSIQSAIRAACDQLGIPAPEFPIDFISQLPRHL